MNQYGHVLNQSVFAYEVRFTDLPPDAKWRRNHVVLVICDTLEEAIRLVKLQWPDQTQIHQTMVRNRDMPVVIAGSALSVL